VSDVSFDVPAEAYGRFMGRFSDPLAPVFADLADVRSGHRAVDVGCGPGALTAVLVDRLGPDQVTGVDPSEPFVTAVRGRLPGVDIRKGSAESLPFDDGVFDRALAQLVVHFMTDPVAGLREMGRVTRSGGVVAACVWDHGGSGGPLSTFWRAARDLNPAAPDEAALPGSREGGLVDLSHRAGLDAVEQSRLVVRVGFDDFETWWEPFGFGVGPAGQYVASLSDRERQRLRDRCHELLGDMFEVEAAAWAVTCRPRPAIAPRR
jgi:SAM-dependent methyltransferase